MLKAFFTEPGEFSFSLGIELTVFDSCNSSTFDDAPNVEEKRECYYAGQGDLVVETAYADSVFKATGQTCGPYRIRATLDSENSTIVGNPLLGSLPYLGAINDEKRFKFTLN